MGATGPTGATGASASGGVLAILTYRTEVSDSTPTLVTSNIPGTVIYFEVQWLYEFPAGTFPPNATIGREVTTNSSSPDDYDQVRHHLSVPATADSDGGAVLAIPLIERGQVVLKHWAEYPVPDTTPE